MTSEDIAKRKWTEGEREVVRKAAAAQADANDSGIDFSDIPPLSEDQLSRLERAKGGKRK